MSSDYNDEEGAIRGEITPNGSRETGTAFIHLSSRAADQTVPHPILDPPQSKPLQLYNLLSRRIVPAIDMTEIQNLQRKTPPSKILLRRNMIKPFTICQSPETPGP